MLLGIPRSARCVQRFDDSLNSAIHITYRISLRSSSMREPRDPLLKVVLYCVKRGHIPYDFATVCVCKDIEPQQQDSVPQAIELHGVHRCEWMCEQSVHMPPFEDQQQLVSTTQ